MTQIINVLLVVLIIEMAALLYEFLPLRWML